MSEQSLTLYTIVTPHEYIEYLGGALPEMSQWARWLYAGNEPRAQ